MTLKDRKTILKDALATIEDLQSRLKTAEDARNEPIAIIGMSFRFPGECSTIRETFWALLRNGVDAISEVPPERWNIDSYYDPDPEARRKDLHAPRRISRRGRSIRRSAFSELLLAKR